VQAPNLVDSPQLTNAAGSGRLGRGKGVLTEITYVTSVLLNTFMLAVGAGQGPPRGGIAAVASACLSLEFRRRHAPPLVVAGVVVPIDTAGRPMRCTWGGHCTFHAQHINIMLRNKNRQSG
jgi:hypothetical protein